MRFETSLSDPIEIYFYGHYGITIMPKFHFLSAVILAVYSVCAFSDPSHFVRTKKLDDSLLSIEHCMYTVEKDLFCRFLGTKPGYREDELSRLYSGVVKREAPFGVWSKLVLTTIAGLGGGAIGANSARYQTDANRNMVGGVILAEALTWAFIFWMNSGTKDGFDDTFEKTNPIVRTIVANADAFSDRLIQVTDRQLELLDKSLLQL